jgi:inorganic triphosphatase YgiF
MKKTTEMTPLTFEVEDVDGLERLLGRHPRVLFLGARSYADTYLDTGGGAIRDRGAVLAIRSDADGGHVLLRTDQGGVISEPLFEGAIAEGGRIDAQVRSFAAGERLGPVFVVETARRRYVLLDGRRWVADVAVDDAALRCRGRRPAVRHLLAVESLAGALHDRAFLDDVTSAGRLRGLSLSLVADGYASAGFAALGG